MFGANYGWLPPTLMAAGLVVTMAIGLVALKRGATDRVNLDSAITTADLSKMRADELQVQLDNEKDRRRDHELRTQQERAADQLRCAEDIANLRGQVQVLSSAWVEDVSSKLVTTFEASLVRAMKIEDHGNGEHS